MCVPSRTVRHTRRRRQFRRAHSHELLRAAAAAASAAFSSWRNNDTGAPLLRPATKRSPTSAAQQYVPNASPLAAERW
jgi:hypothetical protein